MRLRSLFVALILSSPAIAADVAMVDDELGQALLIANRGLCYAVLPNHVSATRDRIALAAPAPATQGAAEIFWRDPANDLALAYVEGEISDRCEVQYTDLPRDISNRLQTAETGLIKSVHFGGNFFDRIAAILIDVDNDHINIKATDADAEVMQGLSGAMLSTGGEIAGLAIDADQSGNGEAKFLRIDRIRALIGAHLGGGNHPTQRPIAASGAGLGFRMTGFDGGQNAGIVALEAGSVSAPWTADWTGAPIDFELTLSNDALVPLNRITMRSQTSDAFTVPRQVQILVDRGLPGSPYWTGLGSPDMSPTGVFEAPTGGTMARRLKIRIVDVWHADRPIRIDNLSVE